MKVTVIIPIVSPGRLSSLYREIESIQAGTYKDVHIVVVVDGDQRLYKLIKSANGNLSLQNISIILNASRMDWVFSQNWVLKRFVSDYYICASDDFVFPPDCIENAVKTMQERFPDGFGAVSLWKTNNAAIGLFGRKLVEHFPECEMFCPEYTHYCADWECVWFVRKLKKLANLPGGENQVKHVGGKYDDTYSLSQKVREKDAERRRKRQEKGYLWGIDFNLLTKR